MPQIFRRSANTVSKLSLAGLLILVGGLIFAAIPVGPSSYVTRAHEYIEQPVQFSHRHHVKDDGIDCRYRHTSVETSPFAGIQDGEVLTACQFACPTEAIVFGDSNDPDSRVAQLKQSPLNYALLADLNTRPRTTYLAIVRNPNTELELPGSRTVGGEGH